MISAKNISKSINEKVLFNGINMTIKRNYVTGLLGANGAGKTSVFRAIAGLTRVDSGEIFFQGKNITNCSLDQRSAEGLCYVPQENSLFEDLTLIENIEMVLELKFKKISKKHKETTLDYLKSFNLDSKRNTKAKFLSGGEKRKTEILRAMTLNIKCLLLDEPFAGVDPISVDELINMLKVLKKRIGIFISDHNFRDVMKVCDKIILMNKGEIILKGAPDEVAKNSEAKKFYFGD